MYSVKKNLPETYRTLQTQEVWYSATQLIDSTNDKEKRPL